MNILNLVTQNLNIAGSLGLVVWTMVTTVCWRMNEE